MPQQWNFPLQPTDAPATDPRYRPYLQTAQGAPLGFGVVGPLRRTLAGDYATAADLDLIRNAVSIILGTDGANPLAKNTTGELPWEPEFGCALYLLRHRLGQGDAPGGLAPDVVQLVKVYVAQALTRWEPRVVLRDVQAGTEVTDGRLLLRVRITYDVRATVSPSNALLFRDVIQAVDYQIAA